jgi:hypothetical protein
MNNKTQRRIHKYFFSHYFCFVFFRKNNIRGNAATNNTPNEGEKNHRGKVKEVERLQYLEGPGKSNNPFLIERVKIPGTHYKISSTDYQAANVWNHRNQILFTTFVLVLAVIK